MLYMLHELETYIIKYALDRDRNPKPILDHIDKLSDNIIRQMYCYGCYISEYDKVKRTAVVSIPRECRLNYDGTDPAFSYIKHDKRRYIRQSEMVAQIRWYCSLISHGMLVPEIVIRDEIWTADKYNQYLNGRKNNMADNVMALTGVLDNTIQKHDKLNVIARVGEAGPGGAYHDYEIRKMLNEKRCEAGEVIATISFQKGPRKVEDSRHGVIDEDLLEIVRDRMKSFQEGEFATHENEMALMHIEEALMWLNKRKEDRAARGVLGTYEK